MQDVDMQRFAEIFAQAGVVTLRNVLPEAMAESVVHELAALEWVLEIKDYTQTDCLQIPLSEIPDKANLVSVLYDVDHNIDLERLFYVRLTLGQPDLSSPALTEVATLLIEPCINGEHFTTAVQPVSKKR